MEDLERSGRRWIGPQSIPFVIGAAALFAGVFSILALEKYQQLSGGLTDPDLVRVPARAIIEAIAVFQKDHGQPPDSLEELKPAYLHQIPKPAWGVKDWEYHRNGLDYGLRVLKHPDYYESYIYWSRTGDWNYDS
jgi:hypothetical protein